MRALADLSAVMCIRHVETIFQYLSSVFQYDSLFQSKKKSEVPSPSTITVPEVSAIRYEAERKKAAMLEKFRKKKPEELEPEISEDVHAFRHRRNLPAEADYLGLNTGYVGDYHYHQQNYTPQPGRAEGADDEEVEWEVDESAYDDAEPPMSYIRPPRFDGSQDDAGQAEEANPAYGPQPGAMWTANYKYQDVQQILGKISDERTRKITRNLAVET